MTPEGRQLFEAARLSIGQLGAAIDRLLAVDRISIAVTTTPSFALALAGTQAGQIPGGRARYRRSHRCLGSDAQPRTRRHRPRHPAQRASPWPGRSPPTAARAPGLLVAAPAVAARITEARQILDTPLLVFHDPGARFDWMSRDAVVPAPGPDALVKAGVLVFFAVCASC
ncbi:hypothetical protein ACU4GD_21835 [Cupriavidus basilensis]